MPSPIDLLDMELLVLYGKSPTNSFVSRWRLVVSCKAQGMLKLPLFTWMIKFQLSHSFSFFFILIIVKWEFHCFLILRAKNIIVIGINELLSTVQETDLLAAPYFLTVCDVTLFVLFLFVSSDFDRILRFSPDRDSLWLLTVYCVAMDTTRVLWVTVGIWLLSKLGDREQRGECFLSLSSIMIGSVLII